MRTHPRKREKDQSLKESDALQSEHRVFELTRTYFRAREEENAARATTKSNKRLRQ